MGGVLRNFPLHHCNGPSPVIRTSAFSSQLVPIMHSIGGRDCDAPSFHPKWSNHLPVLSILTALFLSLLTELPTSSLLSVITTIPEISSPRLKPSSRLSSQPTRRFLCSVNVPHFDRQTNGTPKSPYPVHCQHLERTPLRTSSK